jgi:hypothetical protein
MPSLTPEELQDAIEQVKQQTYSVSTHQIILDLIKKGSQEFPHEDAYIYEHLHEPIEETFGAVGNWAQGKGQLRMPHVKEHVILGTKVKITVTHRGKAEHIYGVDVLYEIEGKKIAAFQHKKADRKCGLQIDDAQLRKIRRVCPACNGSQHRVFEIVNPCNDEIWAFARRRPSKGYLNPGCAALYVVNSPQEGVQGVVSACRLNEFVSIFRKNHAEIHSLVSRSTVDEAFVKCIVGYDLAFERDGRGPVDNQYDSFLMDQHLVFDVLLSRIPPEK